MRTILYRRVSTGDQGLGLAAQLEQLEAEAARRGWAGSERVTDEGVSGSVPAADRPALGPVLAELGEGDVLAVAKLDRLSRSVADFADLVKRSMSEGWRIVVLDLGVDMTTHNGRLVANVLMATAEWEREMISQRVKEGMARSSKRMGHPPGAPAVGGGKPSQIPESVVAIVEDARADGLSPGRIADRLNRYGLESPRGRRWHRTSVGRLLARLDAEGWA